MYSVGLGWIDRDLDSAFAIVGSIFDLDDIVRDTVIFVLVSIPVQKGLQRGYVVVGNDEWKYLFDLWPCNGVLVGSRLKMWFWEPCEHVENNLGSGL